MNTNAYCIYLRKSRADQEAEANGQGDTLARHRTALLELAKNQNLNITQIYEEVVSGDTIADRPEMQKLLAAVESELFDGVLVMEVPRLARGDTIDQGIVARAFKYSGTKIITPSKTYSMGVTGDEDFLEFGLFMSRFEYKAINMRQQRGRQASLAEGKYIAGAAPYGYERVKLHKQKGYTLKIVPEKAEVVRQIFDWYTNGIAQADDTFVRIGAHTISKHLDAMGIPSPSGGKWSSYTIRDIIKNATYTGKVRWGYRPDRKELKDGVVTVSRAHNPSVELIDGLHEAIIDQEQFDKAGQIIASRSNAPVPSKMQIQNPLTGLVYCWKCGRSMSRRKYQHGRPMILCPDKDCDCCSSTIEDVEETLLQAMQDWLDQYNAKIKNQQTGVSPMEDIQKITEQIKKTIETLNAQQARLYDLLEQGVYTVDLFTERSADIARRLTQAQEELAATEEKHAKAANISKSIMDIIPRMQRVIDLYPTDRKSVV